MKATVYAVERDARPDENGKVVIENLHFSRREAIRDAKERGRAERCHYRVVELPNIDVPVDE